MRSEEDQFGLGEEFTEFEKFEHVFVVEIDVHLLGVDALDQLEFHAVIVGGELTSSIDL